MSAPASQHLSAGARHHSGSPSDGQPAEQAPVQQRKSVTYANVDVEDMSAGEYEEYDPEEEINYSEEEEETFEEFTRVSAAVHTEDTSHFISQFSMYLDEHFDTLREGALREYQQMRSAYMSEYQSNFELNTSRKEDKMTEVSNEIDSQDRNNVHIDRVKAESKLLMHNIFQDRYILTLQKKAFSVLKLMQQGRAVQKRKNEFVLRTMAQRKKNLMFYGWRKVSHQTFKQKILDSRDQYREELESKTLNQYTQQVDSLLIYMANLEEKIKAEQEAREKLTVQYEQSLNQGVNQLNMETQIIQSDHPLVDQISLIVAQQLLQNSQGNQNLQQMLRQSSINGSILEQVFQPSNGDQQPLHE